MIILFIIIIFIIATVTLYYIKDTSKKRVSTFKKISFPQFKKDWIETYGDISKEHNIIEIYNHIKMPKRATSDSAGYDFYTPLDITLNPGDTIKIPTGIRCKIKNNYCLMCAPRSGLGTKYRLQLDNTIGIIDSDYYNSNNEGHIFAKITNDSKNDKIVHLPKGTAFMQGLFIQYGITYEDHTIKRRNGGFGSTDKN